MNEGPGPHVVQPADLTRDERSMRIIEYILALAAIGAAAILAIR